MRRSLKNKDRSRNVVFALSTQHTVLEGDVAQSRGVVTDAENCLGSDDTFLFRTMANRAFYFFYAASHVNAGTSNELFELPDIS